MSEPVPVQGCIFCAIAAGDAEASIVHEDEQVVAFMDLHPAAPHHVLVIPRRHASGLEQLEAEDAAPLLPVATRIARAIRASDPQVQGINLFVADGAAAGQQVPHVHLHVISRRVDDDITVELPLPHEQDRAILDTLAARLRSAMV